MVSNGVLVVADFPYLRMLGPLDKFALLRGSCRRVHLPGVAWRWLVGKLGQLCHLLRLLLRVVVHSLGLAGCWVQAFEKPYNDAVKELLGVPDDQVLVAMIAVGVPFEEVETPQKRPLEDVVHWEKF